MTNNYIPNANRIAAVLHPVQQRMKITAVRQTACNMKTYTLQSAEGKELAYFEAGSYLPVYLNVDGNCIERPYSLSSSPKQAENGIYEITVKELGDGYISRYISANWAVGSEVLVASPYPGECYNPTRDSRKVIVLAGGSGITGFYSFAQAVRDGDIELDSLTIFYGVNTAEELLDSKLWDGILSDSDGKIRLVPVVADGSGCNCEAGFITWELIQKYCDVTDASYFISGPEAMIRAAQAFLTSNSVPRRRIRISMSGDSGFRIKNAENESCTLIVHMGGEQYTISANKNETILAALDRSGLKAAARCRSGKCGFCRTMVVNGEFHVAADETGVRKMDQQLGFIHPCCSLPLTDMEIIVQRDSAK